MGQVWGENPERGVYKTEDGGKTWKRILYVDERTGVADLVMDPTNPRKLIAALWDYRRWPWAFRSGGPGSGLYVTYDGGADWKKMTEEDGMPKGDLGRIGLAFAPSDPKIVYALVEAKESALLRSTDGGASWKSINTDPDVSPRPFYFGQIAVDSGNPDRLYRLATDLTVSDDAGKTFAACAWMTQCPTTSMAASRTTARGKAPPTSGRTAASATTTGRRSASATASTRCRTHATRCAVTP
jgi:photosystem II stability/assembly factor-like uncharacterized protein